MHAVCYVCDLLEVWMLAKIFLKNMTNFNWYLMNPGSQTLSHLICSNKKPAYKRHWISWRVRLVASIQYFLHGTCHLSTVTCHPSTTAAATHPPPANSPTVHSRLVQQEKPKNKTKKYNKTQTIIKIKKMGILVCQFLQYNLRTDLISFLGSVCRQRGHTYKNQGHCNL